MERIKEEKKKQTQMASYVERVLDLIERQSKNPKVPKSLQEDLEWAYETISSNKLYKGGLDGFKLNQDRPEVKAWVNMINLKNIHPEILPKGSSTPIRQVTSTTVSNAKDTHQRKLTRSKTIAGVQRDPLWDEFVCEVNINDLATEKLDEINFDPFTLYSTLGENSF